jgi:hypothetical protein
MRGVNMKRLREWAAAKIAVAACAAWLMLPGIAISE